MGFSDAIRRGGTGGIAAGADEDGNPDDGARCDGKQKDRLRLIK
ncbi:MAG: hypothetical protein RIB57_06025 [Pelagibacterium sp.]